MAEQDAKTRREEGDSARVGTRDGVSAQRGRAPLAVWVRWIGLLLGPAAAVLVYFLLPGAEVLDTPAELEDVIPGGLSRGGRATAAVAVLMAVWWMTEALPLSATALLPLALLPIVGAVSMSDAAAPYADKVIFLFMGGFILGLGMQRWGLHRRVALITILVVGTRPRRLVGGFMAATAMMSMWVSNTATVVMMLPIGISVIHLVFTRLGAEYDPQNPPEGGKGQGANFAVALMLGIAFAASIGGVGTLIGTPPNVILNGYIQRTYGQEIGFARWMVFGIPLVIIFLPIAWVFLTRVAFPVRLKEIPGGRELIREELRALGPMGRGEWIVFIVFTLTALSWMLRPQISALTGIGGLTDEGIAMIAAMALFLIPVSFGGPKEDGGYSGPVFAMDWDTAARLPWGILILFGGGLSLAAAVQANEVDRFVGGGFSVLRGVHPMILVAAVGVVVMALTHLMSNTAVANALMPVLGGAGAAAVLGVDPALLLVPAAIAASLAFMLPVATPPNAIVFGSGYVNLRQMMRAGLWLNVIAAVLVTLGAYYAAPVLLGLELGGP